jgi:hypothetical protein
MVRIVFRQFRGKDNQYVYNLFYFAIEKLVGDFRDIYSGQYFFSLRLNHFISLSQEVCSP